MQFKVRKQKYKNFMETLNSQHEKKQNNPLKKWVILLAILTVLFLGTTLYFGFFAKPIYNKEFIKSELVKENLEAELDSLMAAHEKIKAENIEFSEQLSEKDSVILANAAEIKKLIASQADYRKIKKQLERLQKIAQEYITEMDMLYTENKVLKEENVQIKEKLEQTKEEKIATEKSNEELQEKIELASVLTAYNFYARAVYYKNRNNAEIVTEKASKVKKFKTSLIIAENMLREPSAINVYCRISIPGTGRVLTPGKEDFYTFMNEDKQLQYTAKATIDYKNKAENITLYWELPPKDKAIKGVYTVQFFTDEGYLGETFFELK